MPVAVPSWARPSAARHELLEELELEHHPEIPLYALTKLSVNYHKALRSQDQMLVTVAQEKATRASVVFSQRIIKLAPDPKDDEVLPLSHGARVSARVIGH
jgi:hypothetical protein